MILPLGWISLSTFNGRGYILTARNIGFPLASVHSVEERMATLLTASSRGEIERGLTVQYESGMSEEGAS